MTLRLAEFEGRILRLESDYSGHGKQLAGLHDKADASINDIRRVESAQLRTETDVVALRGVMVAIAHKVGVDPETVRRFDASDGDTIVTRLSKLRSAAKEQKALARGGRPTSARTAFGAGIALATAIAALAAAIRELATALGH